MPVVTAVPSKRNRTLAVLCQLWCFLGPILVLALVLRATGIDRRDRLLRVTTAEVLNLQIITLIPVVVSLAALVLGLQLLGIASWLVWIVIVGYGYVVGLVGAIKAWRMEPWSYPVNIRIVRSEWTPASEV